MNKKETQILIDRYLDGDSTPEEEKLLARALLSDDIPDDWKVVRIMLGELAMGEAEYDADVSEKSSCHKLVMLPVSARWFVAASVALLIGLVCFCNFGPEDEPAIAEAVTETAVEQAPHTTVSERQPEDNQQTCQQATTCQKSDDTEMLADNIEQKTTKLQPEPDNDMVDVMPDNTEPVDCNLHYASIVISDTLDNYQPPSRMEDFIVKMADYNHVKGESLACGSNEDDSLTVSKAYVFEDTKTLNLFSRLLQAACWYDDTTPGYLLNYSHQQFFFRLEDLRLRTQYLWIAERVRGKILLYCTHSPLGTDVSSDCFREYRDKLSNTITKPNTKEL